jgi:hypothetical protein
MLKLWLLFFGALFACTTASFADEVICTGDSSKCAKLTDADGSIELIVEVLLPDQTIKTLDVTRVESGLFGKLGVEGKSGYERYTVSLVRWAEGAQDNDILFVQLQAWKEGQRYTVSGPIAITDNGEIIWQ